MKMQIGDEVRDMTQDEIANHNNVLVEQTAAIAAIEAIEAAKTSAKAKLAALGLTDNEINALVGA